MVIGILFRFCFALLVTASLCCGQRFYTYVGDVSTHSVTLAWGTTKGSGNTIGRDSRSHGEATVKIGDRELSAAGRNWIEVTGLDAGREYPYEVLLGGKSIGRGAIRTHPAQASRLVFFVIGDYGNASSGQRTLAAAMTRELEKRWSTSDPPRFVLATGDIIYGRFFNLFSTGDKDSRWEATHFQPYEGILRHVPFYATLGNHDGNSSESRGDLAVYLDNFFFPGGKPARYYGFSFGGLADFFGLDTTTNTEAGPPRPNYGPGSEQFAWLKGALAKSKAPWKIAYFHHPPFSAGPRHSASLSELEHIHQLLAASGVQVAFNGHEHNFQFASRNQRSGGIQYVVTGAGGELRNGRVSGESMRAANIAGWAPQRHFLVVELDEREMRITPIGAEPIHVTGSDGNPVPMPIVVPKEQR
jgi:tartrate-resistant acid phosphatase type 5